MSDDAARPAGPGYPIGGSGGSGAPSPSGGPPPPPGWRLAPTGPAGPASAGPAAAAFASAPWSGYAGATVPPRPPGPLAQAAEAFWAAGRPVPGGVLVVCGVAGALGGAVLVGHRAGLGAALVGLVVWAAAVPALVRRRATSDLLTAALAVALVAMVAVRDAGWIVAVCAAAGAGLAAVAATGARSAPAVLGGVVGWFAGLVRALPWVGRAVRAGTRKGRVGGVAGSVALAIVLLVVFGLLFSSADLVFASYLPDVRLDLLPGQVVVGVVVGLVAVSLAHLAATPPGWSELRVPPGRPARLTEWVIPLVALDAMVVAFVLVQVGGLVGGHRHVLETAGLTYAQYARQGFGQLVAATALTLLVVGVAARRAPRTTGRERLVVRAVLAVMCLATLGVVASALRRMDLYVEAFGLTRLRLFVVVAEGVLGVVLVLVLVAGVRWRGGWLPRAVANVAGLAVLGLALANPDALILSHNTAVLARAAGEEVDGATDLGYLRGLSADAVPAAVALDEPLRSCILAAIDVSAPDGVVDWNLGRAQAADALADTPLGGDGSGCSGAADNR